MAHIINRTCTVCGACIQECPTGSIVAGKEQFYIDADTCCDFAACVAVCPASAITPQGEDTRKSHANKQINLTPKLGPTLPTTPPNKKRNF